MCKLVNLQLKNGTTMKVAENKVGRIKQYIAVFPLLRSVKRLFLILRARSYMSSVLSELE